MNSTNLVDSSCHFNFSDRLWHFSGELYPRIPMQWPDIDSAINKVEKKDSFLVETLDLSVVSLRKCVAWNSVESELQQII
jgi:hypothetical protein